MPIMSAQQRNDLAAEYGAQAVRMSLHTGDPGTTGINEVSGGGYSRQDLTWGAPSAGQVQATAMVDLPATTVTHVGVWDSGETVLLDVFELPAPVTVSVAGSRNVTLTYTQV